MTRPSRSRKRDTAADPSIPHPSIWWLLSDLRLYAKCDRMLLRYDDAGVRNGTELLTVAYELRERTKSFSAQDVPWPDDLPRPQLALPDLSFAPDFFTLGSYSFGSASWRRALAQPAHVVQFVPVILEVGGEKAKQQDYQWMRVLASQPAMDLDRSDCIIEPGVNRLTGQPYKYPTFVWRYAFIEGLAPRSEIFRMDERSSMLLVVDALAERVLAARCTGMRFQHPEISTRGPHTEYHRTLAGMTAHRVGYLD